MTTICAIWEANKLYWGADKKSTFSGGARHDVMFESFPKWAQNRNLWMAGAGSAHAAKHLLDLVEAGEIRDVETLCCSTEDYCNSVCSITPAQDYSEVTFLACDHTGLYLLYGQLAERHKAKEGVMVAAGVGAYAAQGAFWALNSLGNYITPDFLVDRAMEAAAMVTEYSSEAYDSGHFKPAKPAQRRKKVL